MKTKNEFEDRKQDHIKYSLDEKTQNLVSSVFSQVRLIHEALPEVNLNEVSLNTQLLGKEFDSPHFISSMTAGHEQGLFINETLAAAASEKGWLMAVGSQRKELIDEQAKNEWKTLKTKYKKLKLVANIGAEELVKNSLNKILQLIENTEAIGLYIHINPLQEALQNYDQAHFGKVLSSIEKLCEKSSVPVLIKEVGFGISASTIEKLKNCGVSVVDVAGHGGTHWGILEGLRNQQKESVLYETSLAFKDWGYSTVESLQNWQTHVRNNSLEKNDFKIWASGGIRSGVDSLKCLALGAQAVGVAQPLLKAIVKAESKSVALDDLLNVMTVFDYQLKVALFSTGVIKLNELNDKNIIYSV